MHFDIAHSAGKARAQAVQNRKQLVLERPLRRRLRLVLDRTYALVAEHAVHGVFDIEHVVDAQRGVLQKAVSEHYTRVGQIFLTSVEASIARRDGHPSAGRKTSDSRTDKSANRPVINNKNAAGGQGPAGEPVETKGMASEFWQAFHNWAHQDAFKEVKQINAATKTMLRRVVRRETDAGSSYKVIAEAITAKAKTVNKKRAQRIARTEVHRGSTFAVDAAVRSTRRKFEREWVSMADDRTRPEKGSTATAREPWDHRAAHGQRRPMDMPFDVSGEKLMFPGDSSLGASAGNVINCIAGSYKTPVFTDKGWKWIKNIVPGDLVLTHKNRFRKVLRIKNRVYHGELIKISIGRKELTVTPEHPLLVNGKWTQASEIQAKDSISIMASYCGYCGKPIPFWQKFCNISCSSKLVTEKQWASDEHRKNISEKSSRQMKKEYAQGSRNGNDITKAARRVCFNKYGSKGYLGAPEVRKELEPKIRAAINKKYGSTLEMLKAKAFPALGAVNKNGQSKLEKAMVVFLEKKGKEFEQQFSVGKRRVDFYVPKERMFIECDGYYWHLDKAKDRKRDLEILLQYPDHRIAHVSYKENPPKWEYFDLHELNHRNTFGTVQMKIKAVKRFTPTRWGARRVYNFAVEEDESYIVNGFVSHNCRCVLLYYPVRSTVRWE